MPILEEKDILFASKALNLLPGLSENERRVAGAIVDHFNKRTGQCDPGVERLAMLLGINRATVLRATEKLNELGLIEKLSHGGKFNRARYVPNWERFHAIVADWDARMKTGSAPKKSCGTDVSSEKPSPISGHGSPKAVSRNSGANVAGLRRTRSQDCDVDGRNPATQTLRSNPSKEPLEGTSNGSHAEKPKSSGVQRTQNGLGRGNMQIAQRSFLLPLSGGQGVTHGEAAKSAAERRWNAAAAALGEVVHGQIIDWMDPPRQEAATQAEVKRKGGGIAYIVEAIQLERRRINPVHEICGPAREAVRAGGGHQL